MRLDLTKISVTTWLIPAGIFLYTASLWQRPLFISEFAANSGAVDALRGDTSASAFSTMISFVLNLLGTTPFGFRLPCALFALAVGGILFLAGRKSCFERLSTAAALIFLLTPAIFLSGTTALPFMLAGAPLVICFYLLYLMSESCNWKSTLFWGLFSAAALWGTQWLLQSPFFVLFILAIWSVYGVLSVALKLASPRVFLPVICVIPALCLCCNCSSFGPEFFHIPRFNDLRNLAAWVVAGSFPWSLFAVAAVRNFKERFCRLCRDRFAFASLVLALFSLGLSLFTLAPEAFFISGLAGSAVLLGAGMIMEHEENGFTSSKIILYLLAVIFFLAALLIGVYGVLGLHTQLLKASWKLFTSKDALALTAIVPAVAGVWCITGATEKISKERKFLSLCAGIAFLLLAFHGLVPLKVVEHNAPANFLQKVVLPRTGTKVDFYGDDTMTAPLKSVFKDTEIFTLKDLTNIKSRIKNGERFCVITVRRALSNNLPFPKTTLRSGKFYAVFYNIDFPEMRVRKP